MNNKDEDDKTHFGLSGWVTFNLLYIAGVLGRYSSSRSSCDLIK